MGQDNFERALERALLDAMILELLFSPVVIIEVGVGPISSPGLPFDRPPHVHECEPCKFEWQHDTRNLTDVREYQNAHKCPKCGATVSRVKRFLPE